MTLRLRLTLAVVGFVAVALLIADAATYWSLRSFLIDRVDQQLTDARRPVHLFLWSMGGDETGLASGEASPGKSQIPPGTYGAWRDASGAVLRDWTWSYSTQEQPVPELSASLPGAFEAEVDRFTTGAQGGDDTRFRVLVEPIGQNVDLIVAIPLTDVQQTLGRLLVAELLVTVAALVGLGALAWYTVRRGLRPLEAMATTAGQIAAGDLSRRVEPAEAKTEVGRLGLALNAMLEQIELAFDERARTEEKLRRFLADASHELRTPLTSIRGYAEMFRRGAGADPDDLATAMRRIEDESARMGVMVEELLRLARLGEAREPERAPVDLVRLVGDAVSDASIEQPERSVTVEAPASLVVTGDEAQLRQVVANLVGNALRHTPAGTPVAVGLRTADGWAELTVADEGLGMTADDAARAFEPFYRADKSRARETGGTGLGLAIVAAIVADHGGTVGVETAPGAGATFRVRLPLPGTQA